MAISAQSIFARGMPERSRTAVFYLTRSAAKRKVTEDADAAWINEVGAYMRFDQNGSTVVDASGGLRTMWHRCSSACSLL